MSFFKDFVFDVDHLKSLLNLLVYCLFWILIERNVGSYLSNQGSNPQSLYWKPKSLFF